MEQINHQERRHMVTCARGKMFGSRNSMACHMHDKLEKRRTYIEIRCSVLLLKD